MTLTILKTENICKKFNDKDIPLLNNINLNLSQGMSIAIMGASGEGKTTLLHILGALEKPTSGKIFINDSELNFSNAAKFRNSHIGFIFQTYNLLEDLSILENIIMPAKIGRKNTTDFINKALKLLIEVNLEHKKDTPTKCLSGGEKQRVAIARSLCMDPEIILADEPSGNLDYINSKKIHSLLLSFVKKRNKSLIVATHDEELARLCDKRFHLKDGNIFPVS